jgi:YbbR domain-containing protein
LNLREKIFSNLGWKIAAFLLALVLWFHVATEKTYERTFPVKIHVFGLNKSLQVESIEPATTAVSTVATGKQLLQLMLSGGLIAYIDLSNVLGPGQYEYTINLSSLHDIDISVYRGLTFVGGEHFVITVKPRA